MSIYSFKNIKNIFVFGSGHEDFREVFHELKKQLIVKEEDADKPHPKELERLARRRERETAFQEAGGRRFRWDDFRNTVLRNPGRLNENITFEMSDAPLRASIYNKVRKSDSCGFNNSILILNGDYGIGINKEKYYLDSFEAFNKILSYNNSYVIFIRGNHDNPAFFDGKLIDFSNIKAIPDYSVIEACGKRLLCIGGAISTDRQWRKEQEKRIITSSTKSKKTFYWENEAPILNEEAINEIVSNGKIDCVITHTAPSFVTPEDKNNIKEWINKDESLKKDISNERFVMDKIFENLRDKSEKPIYWAYSHFNIDNVEKRSGVIFRSLSCGFNPVSIANDIELFTVLENGNKKKVKNANKGSSFKTAEQFTNPFVIHQQADDNGYDIEPGDLADDNHAEEEFVEEEMLAPENEANEINNEEVGIRDFAPANVRVDYADLAEELGRITTTMTTNNVGAADQYGVVYNGLDGYNFQAIRGNNG